MGSASKLTPAETEEALQTTLPDFTSTLTVPELDGSVTIVRDGHGIPHIKASTERDAFFAQGFVTAQDRLFHMEYDRLRALGRWAEWAGIQQIAPAWL